jgi:acyl-CoA reductase-like NAD-dependent aldehyde dehydrogenase
MTATAERTTQSETQAPTHGIFVGGEWRQAKSGKTFEVRNPATGELLARCADAGRDETKEAIEAAHKAFPAWSQTPAVQRAQLLSKAAQLMLQRIDELA